MRNILAKMILMAVALGLVGYGFGMSDPEQQRPMSTMTVAELEKAGDLARVHKDYTLAIQYFQTALQKDRKNAVLYNKLGLAYLQNNDSENARANFKTAVKRNPKYADALNNIGAVEYTRRNFGGAAKFFKKALALDETRASFHVNLGAAWFGQNKLDRAIAEYTRAVELDPEVLVSQSRGGVTAQISSPEERARYSYMLAKIYAKMGEVDRCLECLRKAKEEGYRDMANVYRDQEFGPLWQDVRLNTMVPPPVAK